MKEILANKTKLIVLIMAASMLVACGKHPNNATVTSYTGSAIADKGETREEVADDVTAAASLYVVESLDMTDETISLYSLDEGKQYRYNYNMTTSFQDKYGDSAPWASFTPGTVVTIGDLLPVSGALSQVKKSSDVWVYDDLSKFQIDPDNGIMTINGSNYKVLDSTKVYSDSIKVPVDSIGSNDVLSVVGQDKEIISISITTGHGYVHLTNTSLFDNSMIFIGNKIVSMVSGDQILEVPEGTYDVTVANNGWGGTGQYSVTRNQITDINLDELKGEGPSYCLITFLVTVPDTYVYIDGEQIDVTEPQYVQYGSHKLVVKCQGYTSWNKTLVVNSESASITLTMESESTDTETSADTETETSESSESSTTDSTTESSSESSSSTNTTNSDYDYQVDYLSTISDLISQLNN